MKQENIFFADFETCTRYTEYFKKYQDTTLLLWVAKKLNGHNEELGTNLREFINYFRYQANNSKKYFCYFHNLNWDGDFILKWLASHEFKAINPEDFKKSKDSNVFTFMRQGRQIYKIQIRLNNHRNKPFKLIFMCSYKILSAPVESLGQALGIAKHNEDTLNPEFYNQEPKNNYLDYPVEFIEYAKRDVEIIRQSFINFQNNIDKLVEERWFLSPVNFEKCFTIGAIAFNLQEQYIKHYSKNRPEIIQGFKIDYETHKLAGKIFFGGITQFNPKYQNLILECKNGGGFDVNSMYPYAMTQLLPYGPLKCFKKEIPKGKYLEYWEMHIESAISYNNNFLCLVNWNKLNKEGNFNNNRYVTSMFNFKCFYLKEEFEELKKFYKFEGITIINRYWAAADNYLNDYVNDLYKLKEHYNKLGQKANALTYKTAMNGSYGKHATRTDFKELFILEDEKQKEELLNMGNVVINNKNYKVSECSSTVKLKNTIIIEGIPTDIKCGNKYYNKLAAATITAHARIKLYKAVYEMGDEHFLYCDTDSIYLKDISNKDKLEIDPYKLGAWDFQDSFKFFVVKGAKAYAFGNDKDFSQKYKARLSGINKNWLAKNFDITFFTEDEQVLKLANLKVSQYPSGLILEWKDYKAKKRLN